MTTVVSLPVLFNRPVGPSHAWYPSYQTMENSLLDDVRSVHGNLAMEHRVGNLALSKVENDIGQILRNQPVGITPDLRDALRTYFSQRYIQPQHTVHFLGEPTQSFPSSTQLVHVSSMSGFFKRLLKTENTAAQLHEVFATHFGYTHDLPQADKDWQRHHTFTLAEVLNALDRQSFVSLMEDVHSLIPAQAPFWWAALQIDLNKQTQQLQNAENTLLALGLGHFEAEDFLLVYQYTVRDAGQMYIPTTPETCAYAYHFPSPPQCTSAGGLSMPLQTALKPCSEFIHHPLKAEKASLALQQPILPLQHIVSPERIAENLPALRQRHRQVLHNNHCADEHGRQWVQKYTHLM